MEVEMIPRIVMQDQESAIQQVVQAAQADEVRGQPSNQDEAMLEPDATPISNEKIREPIL